MQKASSGPRLRCRAIIGVWIFGGCLMAALCCLGFLVFLHDLRNFIAAHDPTACNSGLEATLPVAARGSPEQAGRAMEQSSMFKWPARSTAESMWYMSARVPNCKLGTLKSLTGQAPSL